MSETEKPNEIPRPNMAPPSFSTPIVHQRRETLVASTLAALLLVDFGLIYVLLRQQRVDMGLGINVGVLLVISIISVTVLRVAVSRYKSPAETIPPEDRVLLERLIRDENAKAIELYIRLASLGGPTGTATKLGLTGLPLATIGLTIFFAIVALFSPPFLDLAKLTLGAFIGSFVQRSGEALERAVRATGAPATLAGLSPQPGAVAVHSDEGRPTPAVQKS